MTATCATCRSPIGSDAKFCRTCGARVSVPVLAAATPYQQPAGQPAQTGGGWAPPAWSAAPANPQAMAVAAAPPAYAPWPPQVPPAPATRTGHRRQTLFVVLAGLIVLFGALAAIVVAARRAESRPPAVHSVQMAKKVTVKDGNVDSVEEASTFGPRDTVHAVVRVDRAAKGPTLRAVWTAVSVAGGRITNKEIDSSELTMDRAHNVADFTLLPSGAAPAGSYKVDIYLNNQLVKTAAFTVAP